MLAGCFTPAPKVELTAEQVLEKSAKVYLNCRTYRDSGVAKTFFFEGERQCETIKTFSTVFRRPDFFRFAFTNGKKSYLIWRHGEATKVWSDTMPVIIEDLPMSLAISRAPERSTHSTFALLMPDEILIKDLWTYADVKRLADGEISGVVCSRIKTPGGKTLWIGKDDFLLRRIEDAHLELFRIRTVIDYNPSVNVALEPAQLAFNLPSAANAPRTIKNLAITGGDAVLELLLQGSSMSAGQAEELEKKLTGTEKDISVYTQLLGYYCWRNNDDKGLQNKRAKIVLSLVKKYPLAEVLSIFAGMGIPGERENKQLKKIWQEHLRKNPHNAQLFWNAAFNMLLVDYEFAEKCLLQGKLLEPDNSRWDFQLAYVGSLLAIRAEYMDDFLRMINNNGKVLLKCRMVEKNGDSDAVGIEISKEEVRVALKQTAVVKCVKEHKCGEAVLEDGIVLALTTMVENGVLSLRCVMQFKRLNAAGTASVVVATNEFVLPLKMPSGGVELPPLLYNGKILECYIDVFPVPDFNFLHKMK